MKTVQRIGTAFAVSVLAVSILGSSPANAADTSWGSTVDQTKVKIVKIKPGNQTASDTSWG